MPLYIYLETFRGYCSSIIPFNIVNNDYQQNSRVLYTFAPNKLFRQLLNISPQNFIFLKTFDSEFLKFDQNSKPLEIEIN